MNKVKAVFAAALTTGALGFALSAAAPAHARGQCLFQGDWNCDGPPQYNGPLQPTWDVPPYTWPRNALQCNRSYICWPVTRP